MATRFYLPASGTAPLGSLAVDSSWGRTENLERRPCDVNKGNTSLTQKSAAWAATATNDWVWVQFQSKCLAAGYSWTTADTVSMVLKVAEAAAQVDSHLAYCIRVVSKDGTVVRGTVGVYQATSSEYPTSLANIATRIHDARTDGASNFSSQAGDRIIIEIGHWGVTPTTNTVYHNYGDPSATEDYALTAGLTTDLCPWVELSRDVSFDLRSSAHAYMAGNESAKSNAPSYLVGGIDASSSQDAYLEGGAAATPASSSTPAYTDGDWNRSGIPAYLNGGLASQQIAYLVGGLTSSLPAFASGGLISSCLAFLQGSLDDKSSTPAYQTGSEDSLSSLTAYEVGEDILTGDTPAYLVGQENALGSLSGYTEGYSEAVPADTSTPAYADGMSLYALRPAGDIHIGGFENELGGTPLYASIDEVSPQSTDYILHSSPIVGDYCEVSLSAPTGDIPASNHVIRWQARRAGGTQTIKVKCELRQGASVIASDEQTLTDSYQTFEYQLTQGEIDSISDYDDLRFRFTVTELS